MRKESTTPLDENDRYEGFGVDLIKELSNMLGFNFTIKIEPHNSNGKLEADGTWSGMIGEVQKGVIFKLNSDNTFKIICYRKPILP